ncbi:uncharacterized protein F4807DRAFT_416905 [Annulohypoxylon truncatum]|uniref:uncharacterized protein n=1 Tax=Annulohypoxylon truncatum TaxID=327061 RepID=UPI0020085D25|nr:uncharacterized protein F4807DRAFT_416905 [Annulohypoxylon truncatum]KAI1211923.1 hypothetical protein F4807DRAFT_416905 [Annulohypoxylon truncatum]
MGMTWSGFLLTYLFGGVTFIPLVLAAVLLHAHYMFPVRDGDSLRDDANDADNIVQPGDDTTALREAQKEESRQRLLAESDVAAGYFAVCREYTPMGINAKPIERSTPVGSTTVAAPSQSVYQSMYRSIFDRKPTPNPLDDNKSVSQRPKKAGNVFYVVLRHGHLMLFDDDEQLEVRHVISLAYHDVSIYSGGDPTPEGELFIKRNALCLSRKTDGKDITPDAQVSKPFYLFSENCSAKEDFYFSLLRNQEQSFTGQNLAPKPQKFDVKNIISLVQKLHSTEDHLQTRWLNAFIGRIFLGIYKTKDIQNFIRERITKKISRVNRPSFLSSLRIQSIDTGDAAPYFMNPKLKDFSVEGECGMEADVKYTGNFRLEVAATVRIDLGARFKTREVNIILAVVLRKLEGHMLFKIKPPPSNRMWFSFQSMPKIEMSIEPIVSSRQITYTVILRQIENRIKEVIAETLVLPFWDDIPFFNTEHKQWRGGIFEGDDAVERSPDHEAIAAQLGHVDEVSQIEETGTATPPELPSLEKSHSVPVLEMTQATQTTQPQGFWGRRLNSKKSLPNDNSPSVSASTSASASASTTALDIKSPRSSASEVLRPARSSSISISSPIVGTDPVHADTFRPSSSPPDRDDALSTMASLSARSKNNSPAHTPVGSPAKTSSIAQPANGSANSSSGAVPEGREDEHTPTVPSRRHTSSSVGSAESDAAAPASPALSSRNSIKSGNSSIGRGFFSRKENPSPAGSTNGVTPEGKRNTLAAVSNAAATAKRWGLNAIQRQTERNGVNGRRPSDPPVDLNQPMGRGQPLPPPGTPLPGPGKKAGPMGMPKRKPIAPPPAISRQSTGNLSDTKVERRPVPPPPLPSRRRRVSQIHITGPDGSYEDNVLIVEAPDADSEPNSPSIRIIEGEQDNGNGIDNEIEDSPAYMRPWVEDAEELDGATDRDVSTNGGSEDLIDMEVDVEMYGEVTSTTSETPPVLPPRRATEVEMESEHHGHEQVEQQEEEEDEDGFTNWVDNPGPETIEPAK